jgi:hypothetical protein
MEPAENGNADQQYRDQFKEYIDVDRNNMAQGVG